MMFGKLLNEFDSRMLQKAAEFFSLVLEIDSSEIPVKIAIVDNIGRGKTCGTCTPIFDKANKIKEVKIELKHANTTIGMIEVLAHEMVHARQYIKGDITIKVEIRRILGIIPIPMVSKFWRGKDTTSLSYYEQPYEIEAHLLQRYLTLEFLKIIEDKIQPSTMEMLLNQ